MLIDCSTKTEYLQESLALETSAPSFSKLPFRFAEIAKVILDVYVLQSRQSRSLFATLCRASDDLESPDKIRSLLKDLREARQAKSRDGIKQLDHSELSVSLVSSSLCTELKSIIVT